MAIPRQFVHHPKNTKPPKGGFEAKRIFTPKMRACNLNVVAILHQVLGTHMVVVLSFVFVLQNLAI